MYSLVTNPEIEDLPNSFVKFRLIERVQRVITLSFSKIHVNVTEFFRRKIISSWIYGLVKILLYLKKLLLKLMVKTIGNYQSSH